MNSFHILSRFIHIRLLALFLPVLLLGACVLADGDTLEGTLRGIDCANGELTIVTDEGRTFVMTIDTPDCDPETLHAGQRVRVDAEEDRRTVQHITVIEKTVVNETTVVGKVVNIRGDHITVRQDDGDQVTVQVEPEQVQHLRQDVNVVIHIDQQTNVAQTVTVKGSTPTPAAEPSPTPTLEPTPTPEPTPTAEPTATPESEDAEDQGTSIVKVEGVVTAASTSSISFRTADGDQHTLALTSNTRVSANSQTEASIAEGDEVLVEFDSEAMVAHEVQVQKKGSASDS